MTLCNITVSKYYVFIQLYLIAKIHNSHKPKQRNWTHVPVLIVSSCWASPRAEQINNDKKNKKKLLLVWVILETFHSHVCTATLYSYWMIIKQCIIKEMCECTLAQCPVSCFWLHCTGIQVENVPCLYSTFTFWFAIWDKYNLLEIYLLFNLLFK